MAAMYVARPLSLMSSMSHAFEKHANSSTSATLFHCEVDDCDHADHHNPPASKRCKPVDAQKERMGFLASPLGDFPAQLLRDVRRLKKLVLHEEGRLDIVVLASKLCSIGHALCIRTAIGGGPSCFNNLSHEFLCVRGQHDFEGVEFIVEPNFKEHFEIPHPAPAYKELLASAPEEFVGTSSRLIPLVQMLCSEMAESFKLTGMTLPPWRRSQSMLSKWLPVKAKDVHVSDSLDRSTIPACQICGLTNSTPSPITTHQHPHQTQRADARGTHAKSLLSSKLQTSETTAMSCNPPAHWTQPRTYTVRKMGSSDLHVQQAKLE